MCFLLVLTVGVKWTKMTKTDLNVSNFIHDIIFQKEDLAYKNKERLQKQITEF